MSGKSADTPLPLRGIETDAALHAILEGTATETGERFFAALVQSLARALNTHGAWVTEYFVETRRLRALAFWMDGHWVQDYEVDIAGSPCEKVIDTVGLVHFPDRLLELYPDEPDIQQTGAVSYMGIPLLDVDGKILGHMAVIDRRPMPEEPRLHAIFNIFAARAAAELQRQRAEAEVREREEKVGRLLSSAMDAIIELDDQFCITRANPATEKVFQCPASRMIGQDFRRFVGLDDGPRLLQLAGQLDSHSDGQRSLWIPGGLTARCPGGTSFPAEATLSRYDLHRASGRSDRPFIVVNCAAIPATLIESEFFGHEAGAFTGATKKRDGRFALADKGTIFLDEIGELPIDLQAKLLRVLQEGEFEPVGSSHTRKVSARVLAATNRDLATAVKDGRFREDLYYRLNVFPIRLPPLRERGDDVITLATFFMQRFALRMGRNIDPLTPECVRRLKAYGWPGNVRELHNVIERAVITACDGRLNLERALPEVTSITANAPDDEPATAGVIRTAKELEDLERTNILRALETANWKVSGEQGAARLLGMNPSTLSSRMKALGIAKPARS